MCKKFTLAAVWLFCFISLSYAQNVGIGTNLPLAKLHVKGVMRADSLQVTGSVVNGGVLRSDATGIATWTLLSAIETDPQVSSTAVGRVPRWTGFTLIDGIMQDNGVGLGINTAPVVGTDLTVNGKTQTGSLKITTGASNGYVLQSDAAGNAGWVNANTLAVSYTETDPKIASTINNRVARWNGATLTDGVIFDNGIAVGIGVTPMSQFHVKGTVYIDSGRLAFVNNGGSVMIGESAGENDDRTSNQNVFIGMEAGRGAITGNENIFIGTRAGLMNATGSANVFIGSEAGLNETGSNKLYISNSATTKPLIQGDFAQKRVVINDSLATTFFQMSNGAATNRVLRSDAAGNATWVNAATVEADPEVSSVTTSRVPRWNGTALTDGAIFDNGVNVGIGTNAPLEKIHVKGNMVLDSARLSFTNNGASVFIGALAGISDDFSANNNVFVGYGSGQNNTAGQLNTFIGHLAGNKNITGSSNTALGQAALFNIQSNNNTAIGYSALQKLTTGANNVALGRLAGLEDSVGSNNVFLGVSAGENSQGSGNVFIGFNAGFNETGSNKLYIGNTSTSNPLLKGDFINRRLVVNDSLTSMFFQMTQGAANGYVLQSDASGNAQWVNPTSLAITENDPSVSASTANRIPKWNGATLIDGLITDNGSGIGIGVTNPNNTLSFNGTGSRTIGMERATGTNEGFDLHIIAGGAATGSTDKGGGDLVLSAGVSTGNGNALGGSQVIFKTSTPLGSSSTADQTQTEKMRLSAAGNLGIGTVSPQAKLHIKGSQVRVDSARIDFRNTGRSTYVGEDAGLGDVTLNTLKWNTSIGFNAGKANVSGSHNVYIGAHAGESNIGSFNVFIGSRAGQLETNTSNQFIVARDFGTPLMQGDFITGNLGIGTTNPTQARLVVNGSAAQTYASYGYLNRTHPTGTINGNTNAADYSIYASDRIAASEFNAYSDARIKNIVGKTDNRADLQTLMNIEITDYTLKDNIAKGNKAYKKVIAQQVETVYPQAVSQISDVVPDIYKQAEIKEGTIVLKNNLQPGEKVKLIFETGEELLEVLTAGTMGFTVNTKKSGRVFVFGRQVTDFRTVDYEALGTLNISATQALKKEIDELKATVIRQQQQINELLRTAKPFPGEKNNVTSR